MMLYMNYIDLVHDLSDLTEEELDRLIAKEDERCKHMTEWEDPDEQ